jgi:hypothetical protein
VRKDIANKGRAKIETKYGFDRRISCAPIESIINLFHALSAARFLSPTLAALSIKRKPYAKYKRVDPRIES